MGHAVAMVGWGLHGKSDVLIRKSSVRKMSSKCEKIVKCEGEIARVYFIGERVRIYE